jgi:hypothetical protein
MIYGNTQQNTMALNIYFRYPFIENDSAIRYTDLNPPHPPSIMWNQRDICIILEI